MNNEGWAYLLLMRGLSLFCARVQGEFQGVHFHQGHYEAMGHSLCEVLLDLVDTDQGKVEGIVQNLKNK